MRIETSRWTGAILSILAGVVLWSAGCQAIGNKQEVLLMNSGVMEDETVFFSNDVDDRSARLLLKPVRILSVKAANSDTAYVEGKDYDVDLAAGVIRLLPGSAIQSYNLLTDVLGTRKFANRYRDGQFFFHGEDSFVHDKQIRVTYTHSGTAWGGNPLPPLPQPGNLPNFRARLVGRKPSTVLLVGDSISVGCNASGFVNAYPHQPPFGELVINRLRQDTGTELTFHNISRAGAVAGWGFGQMEALTATNPDLAIIAFGMNDAGHANHEQQSDRYEQSVRGIIEGLRAHNPSVDIILVANMLPNPEFKPHAGHLENRRRLVKLSGDFDRVAIADVMAVTEAILQRKKFADISGNNLNHPNDFLHRIYADVILNVIRRSDSPE